MSEPEGRNSGPAWTSPLRYVGLGFELVVPLLVALYVGYRLDRWLGTRPWLMLVGAVLGMTAGFLSFFRRVLPPRGGEKNKP